MAPTLFPEFSRVGENPGNEVGMASLARVGVKMVRVHCSLMTLSTNKCNKLIVNL